jgi:hypothetical protein
LFFFGFFMAQEQEREPPEREPECCRPAPRTAKFPT